MICKRGTFTNQLSLSSFSKIAWGEVHLRICHPYIFISYILQDLFVVHLGVHCAWVDKLLCDISNCQCLSTKKITLIPCLMSCQSCATFSLASKMSKNNASGILPFMKPTYRLNVDYKYHWQLPRWILAHKVSAVGFRGKTWQRIEIFIKSSLLCRRWWNYLRKRPRCATSKPSERLHTFTWKPNSSVRLLSTPPFNGGNYISLNV